MIGVIIVSYNTSALLAACLESLGACTLPLRIVVVDNASQDESVLLTQTRFPTVEVCALESNRGFAAATNIGFRRLAGANETPALSRIPFTLVLNPDTVVHPGAVETLVRFLQAHPRAGLVSPRLLNPDGTVQRAAFRFPTLAMSLLEVFPPGEVLPGRLYNSWWHGRYPQEGQGTVPLQIDHPLGACMLVRQATVAEVGLLDEHYFMYSEEIAWCWRIRQAGWTIWQVPQAQVVHVGGAATRQFRQHMLIELHRSRVAFFQHHYPARFLAAHRAITRVGMIWASGRAWRDYARGCITRAELCTRLWAYGEIMRL
jgi:Predicted glycosyltransferases